MNGFFNREQLYLWLPGFLQNLAISLEGRRLHNRRYGCSYIELFKEYNERTFFAAEEHELYRLKRFRQFLRDAGKAPYWRDKFSRRGFDIEASDIMAELNKLPILTKKEVKDNLEQISNCNPGEKTIWCHTSGTTGSGLVFPVTRSAEREQWATWWRYRNWHGIYQDTWCGYFGGRSIVSLGRTRPPYWRVNRPGHQIMFSAYHLRENTAEAYIRALVEHDVSWLHGYPSILVLLAGFVRDQRIRPLPPLKVITTGAESLLPYQRRLIREAFGAEVFQHYGQVEGVANLSECEYGRLHADEDFSLIEFIPVSGADGAFKIIGTNWTNPAFPLIRYDTGDIAILCDDQCPCGRPGRMVDVIDGRKEDYLILPNGVRLGRLDHIFKDLVHILEAQIVQFEPGKAVFRIVKGAGYDEAGEEKNLLIEARKRLGPEIAIEFEYTDLIPRTSSGKLRFVVSHITDGHLEPQGSASHTK
ncbi:Coenzyme F390 synthetase-like protein [Syntrophobacter sp. SbD1]|nr:Coenzyme F390 synthetase-like protein [Syntrophobacter sp. SbD1]